VVLKTARVWRENTMRKNK
jgi:hypothetical protein